MNEEIKPAPPIQNDRIMAALAHLTAIIPVSGIIGPIVIWATQRDKSQFVAFQALQAIAYQLVMILSWFAGMACYMGSFFFILIPLSNRSYVGLSSAMALFPFIVFGVLIIGSIIFILYGLVAAVMVLKGKEFRYIFIGNWLTRYLQQK